mmetsp:Transcript_12915/g.26248  ORF Transcript_12915/g.26248 Transcript_12915/m.26248 type:complete len:480 (-) Transcript_12915:178-1617(-)
MAIIQRSAFALLLTLVSISSRDKNTMSASASFVHTPPSTFQPNNLIHSCQERNAMTLLSPFSTRCVEALVEDPNDKQPHNNKKKLLFRAILANGPLLSLSSTAAHAATAMKKLDQMPGGGGGILLVKPLSPSTSLGNPRPGVALVVLALFIAAALLRSAGEGAEYYGELWRGIRGLGGLEKEDGEVRVDAVVGAEKATKMVPYNFYDDAEAVGSTNWDSYKDTVLSPWGRRNLSKKGGWMRGLGKWVLNLMRIREDIQSERETPAAKQKANEIFRQKQYEQHHHVIHAPTTSATSAERGTANGPSSVTASYLNSLHRFSSSVDDDGTISGTSSHGQVLVENEGEKYLDSLSLAKYPKSTWSNYKDNYLSKQSVKVDYESNDSDDEVNELKQEVSTLQDLMQLEQTMYQTSNYALKLAMDAQMQELERLDSNINGGNDNDNGSGDSIEEQLKAFDEKARQFQESVDLPTLEDSKEANWFI